MPSSCLEEVWIAEDNEGVRFMLSRAFRHASINFRPVFFNNGQELVRHYEKNFAEPKLLLLDLQMPGIDGLGALKTLKSAGHFGATPVIVFSSMEDPDTIGAAYKAGANLF